MIRVKLITEKVLNGKNEIILNTHRIDGNSIKQVKVSAVKDDIVVTMLKKIDSNLIDEMFVYKRKELINAIRSNFENNLNELETSNNEDMFEAIIFDVHNMNQDISHIHSLVGESTDSFFLAKG